MYISFFKAVAKALKRMPVKKRIFAGTLTGLCAASVVFGSAPLISYAARTSAGAVSESKLGISYSAGANPWGVVAPGYMVVTPIKSKEAVNASNVSYPDYTLMTDMTETLSATSIPNQTTSSLLFIPKMTWNNETGQAGNNSNYWVRDGSKNYGRASNNYNKWLIRMVEDPYSGSIKDVFNGVYASSTKSATKYFNNIVFCEMDDTYISKNTNKREIGSAAVTTTAYNKLIKEGVYRDRIYEYITDSSKKAGEYGYYNFDKLADNTDFDLDAFLKEVVYGGKKASYKNLDKDLVKNSQILWNAFTQITLSGGTYESHVDRINEFLDSTYDYSITNSKAKKYFSGKTLSNGDPLTLASGSDYHNIGLGTLGRVFNHTDEDESWQEELNGLGERITTVGKNTADDGRTRVYCSNMYRLGYLDLLLTAYTVAANQASMGEKAAAEEGWKYALEHFLGEGNLESEEDTFHPVWINIQMGLMSIQDKTNKGNSNNAQMMFASSQDAVDASYGFATTSPGQSLTGNYKKESTIPASMSYPYPGYPVAAGTSEKNKGRSVLGFYPTNTADEKTIVPLAASKYGATYYDKLKIATEESDEGGYVKGSAWYSTLTLNRILDHLYDKNAKGDAEEQNTTDTISNIELIKSRVSISAFSDEGEQHENISKWGKSGDVKATRIWQKMYEANHASKGETQKMYGSFMICCAPFEKFSEDTLNYAFAAKLTISSKLADTSAEPDYTKRYNQQIKALKNNKAGDATTANHAGYAEGSSAKNHVFSTKGESGKNTKSSLYAIDRLADNTGKKDSEYGTLRSLKYLCSATDAETINDRNNTLKASNKSAAIIEKDFTDSEVGASSTDTSVTINDELSLTLSVQSYTNPDAKADDNDDLNRTLVKFLNKNMKAGTKPTLTVEWVTYKKNPTYTATSKTNASGRVMYSAADKWKFLGKSATSFATKNSLYNDSTFESTKIKGKTTTKNKTSTATNDTDDESISQSGSSKKTDTSAVTQKTDTKSTGTTTEKSAADILASNSTGDQTPQEAVNTEDEDKWVSMFDKKDLSKKTLLYQDEIDTKVLENGITLHNTKDLLTTLTDKTLGRKGVFYQAIVTITYTNAESGEKEKISAISNIAGISYSWGGDVMEANGEPPVGEINSVNTTKAYAELKEGSIYNETFEAMAGVPSTKSLYYSTGGSEFIVNLQAEYEQSKTAVRTYRSLFGDVDCEYKEGDTFKGLSAGQTKTETFKANKNDSTVSTSVKAEANNMVNPTGANAGYNTTTSGHNSETKIYASWSGTISNNTPRPSQNGSNVSSSGQPCEGGDAGKFYTMGTPSTNWDVSAYNTALNQAIDWAKSMEKISKKDDGSVWRIADSDGVKRIYHVGDAVIKVTLSGGTNSHSGLSPSRSWNGGTFTSSDAKSSGALKSNDSGKLGSGWGITVGKAASASGAHTTDDKTGAVTGHSSWSGWTGSTDGATSAISYKIEVTFSNGYTTALDGDVSGATSDKDNISVAQRGGNLTKLPAHALCGACCQHHLPSIEDNWKQECLFDTLRITNVRVWKLDAGYVEGMTEIQEGEGYNDSDEYDVVVSNITQGDPNIFYNIVSTSTKANEMSLNGRIRYSLQTGQDDDVVWKENGGGKRTAKCDGMSKTNGGGAYGTTSCTVNGTAYGKGTCGSKSDDVNPAQVRTTGHVKSWCGGCLYTNTTATDETHGTWYMEDALKKNTTLKKTAYNGSGNNNVKIDKYDQKTLEQRTFWMRRTTDVTATVVSDFLILQTSSGDQPIMYYEETSNTVHTEENFTGKDTTTCKEKHEKKNGSEVENTFGAHGLVHHDVHIEKSGTAEEKSTMYEIGWRKMWQSNANVNTTPVINVGSYNGKYNLTYDETTGEGYADSNKYTGTGNGTKFATAFDDDKTQYTGTWWDDKKSAVTDEYKNTLSLAQLGKVRKMTQGNDPYKSAPSCGQLRLDRNKKLIITKDGIWQNPVNPNKEYETGQSYAFWLQILEYNTTTSWENKTVAAKDGDGYYRGFTYDEVAESEENETLDNTSFLYSSKYQGTTAPGYTGKETNGTLEESQGQLTYGGDTHNSEYNSEVTHSHTAASASGDTTAVNSAVTRHYGITMASVYADGLTKVNNIVVQDPVSVEKAYVVKQDYYDDMDQRVQVEDLAAELNSENTKGECPGTPAECEYRTLSCQYDKAQKVGAFSIDDYERKLYTGADEDSEDDADYGYYIKNGVKNGYGTNATTDIRGGTNTGFTIETADGDAWLVGKGSNASLLIDWSMLSQTPVNASIYTVKANYKFTGTSSGEYAVLSAGIYTVTEKDGYLYIRSTDGTVYKTNETVPLNEEVSVAFTFTIGDVTASEIRINNATATLKTVVAPDDKNQPNYTNGSGIYLGNNASSADYAVSMEVDNIEITREAGTHSHTNACYTTYISHTHTHRSATQANTCLVINEDIVKSAVEQAQSSDGDLSDGESKTFSYTGEIQQVTLAPGTYELEAYGAGGGGNNPGSGGYSAGEITLTEKTTLYIGVGGKAKTFNGGGTGNHGYGGGATHIATADGQLSTLSSNTDSILLVAGGAGGGSSGAGGAGGGANMSGANGGTAGCGTAGSGGTLSAAGAGGTTSHAGAFGKGGSGTKNSCGGGGGYYGGGASYEEYTNDDNDDKGGGGGSGYANTSLLASISGTSGTNSGDGKVVIQAVSVDSDDADTTQLKKLVGSTVWEKIKNTCTVEKEKIRTYKYTGSTQEVTLTPGTYTLSAYGAQGGRTSSYDGNSSSCTSGKGGYSTGVLDLTEKTTIYIRVGGAGNGKTGGYNGGATAAGFGGGGGATTFTTVDQSLSEINGEDDSIILVAGGGGGHAHSANGTAGAGSTGAGETKAGTVSSVYGQGQAGTRHAGAGGGGYHGGTYVGSSDCSAYGTGGSAYANSKYLTSISGSSGTNTGDGYAIIETTVTELDIDYDKAMKIIKENMASIPMYVSLDGTTQELNPIFQCTDEENHICEAGCKAVKSLNCTEPHHQGSHYDISNKTCWAACMHDEWHSTAVSKVVTKDENGQETESMKDYAEDLASFVFLDNFFQLYYPSTGDFYETDAWGIRETQQQRGRGYTNAMSTTAWTREKNVVFPFSVLYNRNGVWEQHDAGEWFSLELYDDNGKEIEVYDFYAQLRNSEMENELIQYEAEAVNHSTIPAITDGLVDNIYEIADQWRELRNAGVGGDNSGSHDKMDEWQDTWGQLAKRITAGANERVCYIYNSDGTNDQDCPRANGWQTNKNRFYEHDGVRYFAYHSAWKCQYIDLVGRIGNLTVEDTTSLYFANLFKQSKGTSGWILDGLVKNVDPSLQNKYAVWKKNNGEYAKDVRYETVSKLTGYLNTYSTSDWADFSGKSNDSGVTTSTGTTSTPISGSKNTITALRTQNLQPGDDLLWDVTTIGNYWDGNLQIKPYFYALNVETDELIPVDVYIGESGNEKALNYFGLLDLDKDSTEYQELKEKLYDKAEELNWEDENTRRNYNTEEAERTDYVAENETEFLLDADGNTVGTYTVAEGEDGAVNPMIVYAQRHLLTPYGSFYRLGNLQLLYPEGRARTFIGDSHVVALNSDNKRTTDKYKIWKMYTGMDGYSDGKDINGDNNQELGNRETDYYKHAQRWHLTLGLDSEVTFVPYRGVHNDPLDVVTYADGTVGQAKYELMYDSADTVTNPDGKSGLKGNYVIIMSADIVAIGDVYNLRYSQGQDNGVFDVTSVFYDDRDGDGVGEKYEVKKRYDFGTSEYSSKGTVTRDGLDYSTGTNNVSYTNLIPTILGVYYGTTDSPVSSNVNITQSH